MGDNRELYIQVNCLHQVDDNKTYCAVIVQGATGTLILLALRLELVLAYQTAGD